MDGNCNKPRQDAICISQLKSASHVDAGLLQQRADMKIILPYHFNFYDPKEVFKPDTYNRFLGNRMSEKGFDNHLFFFIIALFITVPGLRMHVSSVIDGISFVFPPSPPLSQIDDIAPEQFCNGDNKPEDCGQQGCLCTHQIDIPFDAVVELMLLDESKSYFLTEIMQ